MHPPAFYIMVKFHTSNDDTFRDINYFLVNYFLAQTDGQTESDAYEPTVRVAQVGSIMRERDQSENK